MLIQIQFGEQAVEVVPVDGWVVQGIGRMLEEETAGYLHPGLVWATWHATFRRFEYHYPPCLQPTFAVAAACLLHYPVQRADRSIDQREVQVYACLYYLGRYEEDTLAST
jgi:hypothetical protein